jgi:hypothetical protein
MSTRSRKVMFLRSRGRPVHRADNLANPGSKSGGCRSTRFQSKALRIIVDAPWYVPNTVIRRYLQIPTIKKEIRRCSSQYRALLSTHQNELIVNQIELPDNRRLRRHLPKCLPTRLLM